MDCCQDVPVLSCRIVDIEKRIEPIQYTDGVLEVDAPVSIGDALIVGGAEISTTTGRINMPAKTLVNGAPLLSDAFTGLSLPANTKISGYYPVTEQYYYYYTAASGNAIYEGYILNGQPQPVGSRTAASNQRCFSFIVPEDSILTSLSVLFTYPPGSYGTTIASGFLDVMDTNLAVYYTGVYFEVPASSSGRGFVENQFEYLVRKGDSVAVYIQRNPTLFGASTAFATLGFKVAPPQSLTSTRFMSSITPMLSSPTTVNRFPANGILSSIANRPTHIMEQLERLQAGQPIHGRPLTPHDYQTRMKAGRTYDDLEKVLMFFFGEKRDGSFVDISSSTSFNNSQRLQQDYGWQGIQVSHDDIGSMVVETDADYLSLDRCPVPAFEAFAPTLATRKFGFVTVGHDGDGDAQSVIGNALQYHGYARIFTDVLVAKSADHAVREDWFAHLGVVDPNTLQKIREHPENTEGTTSARCLAIIRMLFDYRF